MNIDIKTKRDPTEGVALAAIVERNQARSDIAGQGIPAAEERRLPAHSDQVLNSMSDYYRLRYVEADHVVFDPVSGMELPATRENIMTMLQTRVRNQYGKTKDDAARV